MAKKEKIVLKFKRSEILSPERAGVKPSKVHRSEKAYQRHTKHKKKDTTR